MVFRRPHRRTSGAQGHGPITSSQRSPGQLRRPVISTLGRRVWCADRETEQANTSDPPRALLADGYGSALRRGRCLPRPSMMPAVLSAARAPRVPSGWASGPPCPGRRQPAGGYGEGNRPSHRISLTVHWWRCRRQRGNCARPGGLLAAHLRDSPVLRRFRASARHRLTETGDLPSPTVPRRSRTSIDRTTGLRRQPARTLHRLTVIESSPSVGRVGWALSGTWIHRTPLLRRARGSVGGRGGC
jgi:hypothetical protein